MINLYKFTCIVTVILTKQQLAVLLVVLEISIDKFILVGSI